MNRGIASTEASGREDGRPGADWLARRKWALVAALAFVTTGIAFTFWWGPLVTHVQSWVDSGDLWDTYRAAQWVGWGNEGTVYEHGIYSIVFPGIDVLLAPVAMVATHFGLTDPYPYYLAKPSVLPLLMPYVLVVSAPALFAFDELAELLGVRTRRRVTLCWIEAVLLWPVVVMWGHPEEAIALAFVVLALIACVRARWTRGGWLLGFAVAFQPYALLLLPLMVGMAPRGRRLAIIGRSVLVSCALLVLPVLQAWHATAHAILLQPTLLIGNHPTPLLALAPRLAHGVYSAGPGRYLVVLAAVAVGWWTWARQPDLPTVVWSASLVLLLRCVLEPVAAPYYVWAGSALLVAVGARRGLPRFCVTIGAVGFASVWAYHYTSEWAYWTPIVLALALASLCARPPGGLATAEVSSRGPHLDRRMGDETGSRPLAPTGTPP